MFRKSASLLAVTALAGLVACNDSSSGNGSPGSDSVVSQGLERAEALDYNKTYSGESGHAAPSGGGPAEAVANAAFLLWNLQQVQRGIDDTTSIKLMLGSEFVLEEDPWNPGFNGTPCGAAGDFDLLSGSPGDASGTVELTEFCFTDGQLTDHEEMVVSGTYHWENGAFDVVPGQSFSQSYRVKFEDLEVQWRGDTWILNGASETRSDSTERAFALDVTDESGEVYRIMRVIRTDADTLFSEAVWHPDHGKMTFRSTRQDLQYLFGDWAGFGGVCNASAWLLSDANALDMRIRMAQKSSGSCNEFNLEGTDADGQTIPGGPFTVLDLEPY